MAPTRTVVRQPDIVAGLRCVRITPGDVVFAHSSLSAFGRVEGGAEAVVDALLEAVGESGTIAVPAFTWSRYHAITEPVTFDPARESVRDEVGAIPEALRRRPDALRSLHICHSIAAIGPHAHEVMGDGVKSFGEGSSFAGLEDLDAWYLFLGAGIRSCTALHHVEDLMRVPYRSYRRFEGSEVVLPGGGRRACESVEFLPDPGVRQDFSRMEAAFDGEGVLHRTTIGEAAVMNLRIRDLVRIGRKCLEGDIEYLCTG